MAYGWGHRVAESLELGKIILGIIRDKYVNIETHFEDSKDHLKDLSDTMKDIRQIMGEIRDKLP